MNYCTGNFIFVEELINGKQDLTSSRKEFIKIIDSLFTAANSINDKKITARNPKSNAVYKYLGYYKLMFSDTNPDNSTNIFLNDKKIDRNQLIKMFNLDDNSIEDYKIQWSEKV